LEEALDLSSDRILNEWMNEWMNIHNIGYWKTQRGCLTWKKRNKTGPLVSRRCFTSQRIQSLLKDPRFLVCTLPLKGIFEFVSEYAEIFGWWRQGNPKLVWEKPASEPLFFSTTNFHMDQPGIENVSSPLEIRFSCKKVAHNGRASGSRDV
jgi:hypothetical protein